jgi:hypothetical protein
MLNDIDYLATSGFVTPLTNFGTTKSRAKDLKAIKNVSQANPEKIFVSHFTV